MAKNKKLVVWDIDGTLLDTTQGVVNAVRYVLSELNYLMKPLNYLLDRRCISQ